jgi:transcription antitermination factor NusG
MGFTGFTDKDLDAYLPAHRTSAMYTLARRQVKDKLKVLLDEVTSSLGPDVAGMERVLSSDSPSLENSHKVADQSAWVVRGKPDQEAVRLLVERMSLRSSMALDVTAFHKHAALGIVLGDTGVRHALSFHPRGQVDRQNLHALLAQGWAQDAFLKLVRELPDGFRVTLPGGPADLPVAQVTVEQVMEAGKGLPGDGLFSVFRCHDRAVATSPQLASSATEDVKCLVPLYKFGAWTRDNDHIQALKVVREQKQEAQRTATPFQPGDRVKILGGLWSGRAGVVDSVDKKGTIKVMVGLVAVKVEARDIELA